MSTGVSELDPRQRKLRPWRWLRLVAGFGLAAAFFMPVLQGCRTPIIPAVECRDALQDQQFLSSHLQELAPMVSVYVVPYLLGLLLAASALGGLVRSRRADSACDWMVAGLLLFVCGTALVAGAIGLFQGMPASVEDWVALALLGPVPGYCVWHTVRGMRLGPAGAHVHRALATALIFGWFCNWLVLSRGDAYYGLYVSVLSSWLLVFSVVQEARILSGEGVVRTCLNLALARMRIQDLAGRCLGCGYDLRGLPEPRCPECGSTFAVPVAPLAADAATQGPGPNS